MVASLADIKSFLDKDISTEEAVMQMAVEEIGEEWELIREDWREFKEFLKNMKYLVPYIIENASPETAGYLVGYT